MHQLCRLWDCIKHLDGGDWQVAMVVLVAQVVMIPVALLTGKFSTSRGRKPIVAIAFLVLPLRIFLYTFTTDPNYILGIQALDGIGAGIYGVAIALMYSDLAKGKSGFNTLLGIMQTALALGGIIGPLAQGFLTQ
jgi:MFS family permease